MVLTCAGPDQLFESHKLVLNVPFSDAKRVGVFCARGECPGRVFPSWIRILYPKTLSNLGLVCCCLRVTQFVSVLGSHKLRHSGSHKARQVLRH